MHERATLQDGTPETRDSQAERDESYQVLRDRDVPARGPLHEPLKEGRRGLLGTAGVQHFSIEKKHALKEYKVRVNRGAVS